MSGSFLPDSSVLVADAQGWHQFHEAAHQELTRRLEDGQRMFLAAHSLLETYAVLTGYPRGLAFSPADALNTIRRNYIERGEVVALSPEGYLELLLTAASNGITGGRTYDALIATTARKAGADVLLTFNTRHFQGLVPGLEVVVPAAPDPRT